MVGAAGVRKMAAIKEQKEELCTVRRMVVDDDASIARRVLKASLAFAYLMEVDVAASFQRAQRVHKGAQCSARHMVGGSSAQLLGVAFRWRRRPQGWEKRSNFSSWLLPFHVKEAIQQNCQNLANVCIELEAILNDWIQCDKDHPAVLGRARGLASKESIKQLLHHVHPPKHSSQPVVAAQEDFLQLLHVQLELQFFFSIAELRRSASNNTTRMIRSITT